MHHQVKMYNFNDQLHLNIITQRVLPLPANVSHSQLKFTCSGKKKMFFFSMKSKKYVVRKNDCNKFGFTLACSDAKPKTRPDPVCFAKMCSRFFSHLFGNVFNNQKWASSYKRVRTPVLCHRVLQLIETLLFLCLLHRQ